MQEVLGCANEVEHLTSDGLLSIDVAVPELRLAVEASCGKGKRNGRSAREGIPHLHIAAPAVHVPLSAGRFLSPWCSTVNVGRTLKCVMGAVDAWLCRWTAPTTLLQTGPMDPSTPWGAARCGTAFCPPAAGGCCACR